MLYGRIVPDAAFRGGQKAQVEALYEPPQRWDAASGALKVLVDPNEANVAAVAGAMGLSRIGWIFTKKPKAAGDPELAPRELVAMALMQGASPRRTPITLCPIGGEKRSIESPGGSQFVTIVLRKGPEGIAPQGYMASDQLCAMVRDGVLSAPSLSDKLLRLREPQHPEPPVPEVIVSSKDRGRRRAKEFEVELGMVTLEAAGSRQQAPAGSPGGPVFRHCSFPVENRAEFGILQSAKAVASHLSKFAKEPLQHRCSDFHLLVYLAGVLGKEDAAMLASAVARNEAVPDGLQLMLESIGL
jgi:nuclear protein localization family protein 4